MVLELYSITLFIHIMSIIAWLMTLPITTIIGKIALSLNDTAKQVSTLGFVSINSKIALVSSLLVFITGSILVEEAWTWAPKSGAIWLVIKQTIWFITLVLGVIALKPSEKKLTELVNSNSAFDDVYVIFKSLKLKNHIISGFILVNIFLATTKPF